MSNMKATKAKEIYDIIQRLNPFKLRLLLNDIEENVDDFWNDLDIRNWESIINHRIEDILEEETNRIVGEALRGD